MYITCIKSKINEVLKIFYKYVVVKFHQCMEVIPFSYLNIEVDAVVYVLIYRRQQ